ncbi:MAG: glycoside hydrolase family 15 protein [Candidatus Competibacteraceae bacterium]|nr:glycoside hydrolase family 15 protein [Candidatus Competibacteraceae bacterium]
MAFPLEDYALIGDCQSAALVARDGSIDWLCFPRFDSGACFAALLGEADNGRWKISPACPVTQVRRRYRQGTLILETDFECDGGSVTVIDFMPPRTESPDVVRIIQGRRGEVPMKMELIIRFDYGWVVPWVRHVPRGIRATAGPDTLYCRGGAEMHGENLHTVSEFTLREGQEVAFTLTWTPTHAPDPSVKDCQQALVDTQLWWRQWSEPCRYQGEWREAVVHSLIVLKALTYAPTGGIIAAATTSLPEELGGVRNWDYRFCWLRDATFTLYALMTGGYIDEARAWREWLVNAVAGKPSEIQIMYGVAGERRLTELELDWLSGYENSRPVRIGNAAYAQHQLDVYGEVMDAMHSARRLGLPPESNAWRVQRALLNFLESDWQHPDEGIWEVRGPRRHFTHSKVMAWVGFDRAVKAVEQFGLEGPVERWRALRDQIHRQVCREGFDTKLNAFTQYYGSREADASLLMLPLVGFLPATDPRMIGTVNLIERQLVKEGLVERYPTASGVDGLAGGEGTFLICTFWLADNLALQGRYREARELFEQLLSLRNDVGLLAEEYDTHNQRLVGNFPQAFSHVGLINTARNLVRHGGPAEERQQG